MAFFLILLCCPSLASAAPPAIIPERDIVLSDTSKEPEWKALWDEARALTRQEKYSEAAQSYSRLLALKKNIEEASWEYSLVLMALSDWDQASALLDDLLETDPLRIEYLLSAGLVALKKKEYARAFTYYDLVYQKKADLNKTQLAEGLSGLVAALHGQGKHEAAYPLMEDLLQQRPDDAVLLRQLAAHAAKSGRTDKALLYYEKLVSQEKVTDEVLLEAAVIFDRRSQESKAVHCWEKYLQRHPDHLPFQQKMADYLIAQGKKEAALPHLLILLAQGDQVDDRLLQIGAIYWLDLGRPDKALSFYEDYCRRHPENQAIAQEVVKIRSTLANDLASRVGRDGALPLWNELAPITPNRLAIYAAMAKLLEERGNSKELREVLAIIQQHDPENQEVQLRLAELFLEQQDIKQAEHFLGLLSQEVQKGPRYLLIRARLADRQGVPGQALVLYNQYLTEVPGDQPIRLRCLELTAQLGLMSQYQEHYLLMHRDAKSDLERINSDLNYARVLLENGLATRAKSVCQHLLETEQGGGDEILAKVRLTLADALYLEGDTFEAEQLLRQMLVDGVDVEFTLRKLVDFSLQSKEFDLAWAWLTLLSEQPGYSFLPVTCGNEGKNLSLLQARVLASANKLSEAIDSVEEYRAFLVQNCRHESGMIEEADILLSHLLLQDKQDGKGRRLTAELLKNSPMALEPLILDQQFEAALSGKAEGSSVDDVLGEKYGNSFLSLMEAARLERKYGDLAVALRYVRMALKEVPGSTKAMVLQAEILREQGDLDVAYSSLLSLMADYPDELSFSRKALETEFKLALFEQIIEKLVPSRPIGLGQGILSFPETSHLAVWQKLILARALWADRQWVAAVAVYDTLLHPSVDMLFTEMITKQQIQLVLPPPKQTFWDALTFRQPAEPDRLTVVMDPAFIMSQRGLPGGKIGADLYASYRWQQLVSRELSARRELAQGNYYQAMKEYQEVVDENPSPESLFDLAGIYSRLGLLGKEALLYEEIERENPDYPGLAESVQRNSLKREPKVKLDSAYTFLNGRSGYLDIQETRGGAGVWMLPTLRQEMDVSWSTSHAITEETDQALWRNRMLAAYSFYPHYNIDFITKLGAEKHDTEHDHATPLYHLETRGRIGDELVGFVRLRQDVVDDTVQALEQGISQRDLEGGVKVDILPRLFCGGEYLFREYSDANHQNRYNVWVSYILHSEPTLLEITYGQELVYNADGNMGRDYSYENGFAPGDHPYWSPKEYWQNVVSVHFEHQLAADVFGRSAPSYYTLDYSFGYEDGGYDNHSFGGDIFLEMSRHFLLSSSFSMTQGGQEIRKDVALSLLYRW